MIACGFERVSKSYRSSMLLRRIPVLQDISFEVQQGETFAYLGHNGAGKTTSIKALLGLIRVDEGVVRVNGHAPGTVAARSRTGYLPENPYFYDHLTGEEFLLLAADLHGMDRRRARRRCAEVLELVAMSEKAGVRMRSYSKGMLQRIGLAQALIADPDLIILDEPMGGLDPVGRHQVRSILEELHQRGKTLFMSSHILADVESLADRAAILSRGELRRVVDLQDLRVQGRVMEVETRGLTAATRQTLAAAQIEIRETTQSQRIAVANVGMLSWVVEQVVSSGAHLIQVTPRRRSLEEIFLQEVGSAPVSLDPVSAPQPMETLEEEVVS